VTQDRESSLRGFAPHGDRAPTTLRTVVANG
jgi:hypothetical protein